MPYKTFVCVFIFFKANKSMEIGLDNFPFVEWQYGGILRVHDGVSRWGQICASGWDFVDGDTACRQLGFTKAVTVFSLAVDSNDGTVDWFLDHLSCAFYIKETSLQDCVYGILDECGHADAEKIEWPVLFAIKVF